MKLIILVLVLLAAGSLAAQPSSDHNFGFENNSKGGKLPDDWFEWGNGFRLAIDTTTMHTGKRSVSLEPFPGSESNFGCVAYKISQVYEAKEIEVRAYMKLSDVRDGTIGLLLRIDGPAGSLGFDNMMYKNIQGTKDWTMYSVKLPYPEDVQKVYVGAMLSGKGKVWVDDFEVLVDGKDIREAKTRKPKEYKATADKEFDRGSEISGIIMNQSRQEDLAVLGKVWGFLKYYHPTVAAGDINWDYELFRVLPKVLNAQTAPERNAVLSSWVSRLGEVPKSESKDAPKGDAKIKPDLAWINAASLGDELTASLRRVLEAKRTGANYYVGMTDGVGNPEFKNEKPYSHESYPDQGYRLLSLYRYWNIIQYFFPYKNLIEEDWNNVLFEYVPQFVNAGDALEYKLATLSIIARIHDTHANIWGGDAYIMAYKGKRMAALELIFVENKAVVTSFYDDRLGAETGAKVGDVIEEIDGKSVAEITKSKLDLTPASNYPTQLRDIAPNLLRTNDTILNIKYRRDGKLRAATLRTYEGDKLNVYTKLQKKDTCFRMITPDIAYLYPGSLKNEYLAAIMAVVKNTKGLIIDFRCYPSDYTVFSLSEYLQPGATSFVKFSGGSLAEPGLFTMREGAKIGRANEDYYKGKVVILINEKTQSSAEYHTMAFRTVPGAMVVGSTTAGADGNVSKIVLPGGINTMISGIGVYYPDGRETQRIGIVPDVEMKPTIKGIKEGKDEVLGKAIAIIDGKMDKVRTVRK